LSASCKPRKRQGLSDSGSHLHRNGCKCVELPCLQTPELDPGEREAIALAEALHADALIIDEKLGRREAERRKLRVIGTLRVLDDAAEEGLVDLSTALSRLQGFGFYLDTRLLQFLLDRDSARRRKTKS
jgi:predicted nucleic acid-binding protein